MENLYRHRKKLFLKQYEMEQTKKIFYLDRYENTSRFRFWEARGEHIIYKSEVSRHTTEKFPVLKPTVDVVFVGTMFFEFVPTFEEFNIFKAKDEKSFALAKTFDKGFEFLENDERVYMIQSINCNAYLVTAGIWIYEHNCQNYESFFEKNNYFDKVAKTIKIN